VRDERRNYLVAGGFVVAMLVALLVWIGLLSGRTWGADRYHVHFARVHGLKAGTKVFFDGYPVGLIEGIARPVDTEQGRRFRVDLRIRDGWRVPEDSRARVLREIFSGVVIDIRGGSSETPIPPGGEIPGEEGGDVFADVQSIARKFDAMLEELRPVIDEAAAGGPEIVASLRSLTADLERAGDRLGALLSTENADRVGRALANVEETSENLATLTRSLESTRAGLDGLVTRVGQLVDEDRGDVSEALRNLNHSLAAVARHIDAIAADLETSSRNLAEFTRGVREDPGVLVRGRERAGDGGPP
jgi:phospholipid/cholesterol/gamma-HCH transport system substrate-binding protein